MADRRGLLHVLESNRHIDQPPDLNIKFATVITIVFYQSIGRAVRKISTIYCIEQILRISRLVSSGGGHDTIGELVKEYIDLLSHFTAHLSDIKF